MMPLLWVFEGPTRRGVKDEAGIRREGGGNSVLREFDAVAGDAGKANFEAVAVGTDGADGDGLSGRLGRGDNWLGVEVEGNAEDIGVFDIELVVFVKVVRLAAEGATDDLFTEELSAEGADAEDMGNGVGVPAFGEHGDGDDAADGFAECAGFADGVHDFAEEGLVGEVVAGVLVAGSLDHVAAEAIKFGSGHGAKVFVERVAGFELFAVDEKSSRARVRGAVLIGVAEELVATRYGCDASVLRFAFEAGDVVVYEFRGGSVVADDDEAGRDADAGVAPDVEGFFVVAVEDIQGGDEFGRQAERVDKACFAATFFRHVGANVIPEIAEDGDVGAGNVVGDRDAGEFDDSALDGVHEGEVAHGPGEEGAFGVAGAAEEEGGGGEVDDLGEADLAVDGFEAGDPEAGGFAIPNGFIFGVALEVFLIGVARFFAVAVVGFVVDDEDVFEAHEFRHDALDHLAFGFFGFEIFAVAAFEESAGAFGYVQPFARFEGVVIRDDDPGFTDLRKHVPRDEFAGFVITVGVVRLQDAEAVFNGEAGGDDEEAARKLRTAGAACGIDGLPGHEHGHHGGFAGSCGELEGKPEKFGVCVVIGVFKVLDKGVAGLACFRRDFGKPDGGFDCLDLAEERADGAERVRAPVLQESLGFRGDLPGFGVGPVTPTVDMDTQFVDDGGREFVLLARGGKADALIEAEALLLGFSFLLSRFRNGRDEFGFSARFDDFLSRLAGLVEFPNIDAGIGRGN